MTGCGASAASVAGRGRPGSSPASRRGAGWASAWESVVAVVAVVAGRVPVGPVVWRAPAGEAARGRAPASVPGSSASVRRASARWWVWGSASAGEGAVGAGPVWVWGWAWVSAPGTVAAAGAGTTAGPARCRRPRRPTPRRRPRRPTPRYRPGRSRHGHRRRRPPPRPVRPPGSRPRPAPPTPGSRRRVGSVREHARPRSCGLPGAAGGLSARIGPIGGSPRARV